MQFSRLETAIELARRESTRLSAIDARLQSFVAAYLIVEIISEFERRLEAVFALRVQKLGDKPCANFMTSLLNQKFRSPDVGKISNAITSHDPTWKVTFDTLVGKQWKPAMDRLMQNRHYYVHKSGTATMSLQDVIDAYGEAVKVFDALVQLLGLTAADCAHLT